MLISVLKAWQHCVEICLKLKKNSTYVVFDVFSSQFVQVHVFLTFNLLFYIEYGKTPKISCRSLPLYGKTNHTSKNRRFISTVF